MRINAASVSLSVILFAAAVQLNAGSGLPHTWVSATGDDGNTCAFAQPCLTLAAAIEATAAGGEVSFMNSGDFAAAATVTITKSIIIAATGVQAGFLTKDLDGIVINAGADDVVVLRGLDIVSQGSTAGADHRGIKFEAGGVLFVEDCRVTGFTKRGISIESSTDNAKAFISNTIVRNQTNNGIVINPPSVNNVVVLDHVQVVNSTAIGLAVNPGGRVDVTNSTFSHNAGAGVWATGPAALSLESSLITDNGVGLELLAGAAARLSNVNVAGNTIGFSTAGGALNSFGNNHATGNTDNAVPTINTHLSPL